MVQNLNLFDRNCFKVMGDGPGMLWELRKSLSEWLWSLWIGKNESENGENGRFLVFETKIWHEKWPWNGPKWPLRVPGGSRPMFDEHLTQILNFGDQNLTWKLTGKVKVGQKRDFFQTFWGLKIVQNHSKFCPSRPKNLYNHPGYLI